MGETPRTYSSLSTLYYIGHKPTFCGEREQIKNIRERKDKEQLRELFTFSAIFSVLKHMKKLH